MGSYLRIDISDVSISPATGLNNVVVFLHRAVPDVKICKAYGLFLTVFLYAQSISVTTIIIKAAHCFNNWSFKVVYDFPATTKRLVRGKIF